MAALIWNLADVVQPSGLPDQSVTRVVTGESKLMQIRLAGIRPGRMVSVRFVDQERGSPMPAWRAMGSPQYPTPVQLDALRQRADIPPATTFRLDRNSQVTLELPPEGVALLEVT